MTQSEFLKHLKAYRDVYKRQGYECAVWDDWSRDDKRYVEGDCVRRWATFKGSERPITVRTIRAMARKNGWVSAFTDFEDTRELAPTQTLIRLSLIHI